jgi:hypothetical protein
LAASPDRLENDDGLLEVKCPYSYRNNSIPEALDCDKFYISMDESGEYSLRKNHKYFDQCLHISGRNHLNFFFWLPNGTVRVRVERDDNWGKQCIPLLIDFWFNIFLPAYMSKLQIVC